MLKIFCLSVFIVIPYLMLVSCKHIKRAGPLWDSGKKYQEIKKYNELLPKHPAFKEEENSSLWSEQILIKIYYDCEGKIFRKELTKVKTRAGADGGNDLEEYKTTGADFEGGEVKYGMPEKKVVFQSMKERFRKTTTTPQPLTQDQTSFNLRPLIFKTDTLIDTPARSCPEGQNFDMKGDCRREFKENIP